MTDTTQNRCHIQDATDYIIAAYADEPGKLSVLKLQKLLYYVQAWHLAKNGSPLFDGKFQAWVHGPVNRQVYDRFRDTHSLYSPVTVASLRDGFARDKLAGAHRAHIDEILEAYGDYTGTQLEDMTHDEQPWVEARGNLKDYERCETEIAEQTMLGYYQSLLEVQ